MMNYTERPVDWCVGAMSTAMASMQFTHRTLQRLSTCGRTTQSKKYTDLQALRMLWFAMWGVARDLAIVWAARELMSSMVCV